ncbi:hypothetical protein [Lacticaseibacillus yichunensis]|uniref:Uncharacterized protein n=1 Tax=Lacticaseibacillus yichunensis TaxID=2486015 RepID=A0ABW4CLG7_9LACO|nr:hypothetical protein [Lacticaseibacillus yichunensis]
MLSIFIWMIAIILSLWALTESPLMDWVDKKLVNNKHTAKLLGYTEQDIAELNAKKAPAEATAGAKNFNNNIYPFSVARSGLERKAAK